MPGFVDTSNMSDLEIKRLGQVDEQDDPSDNPHSYRNLSKRNPYGYNRKNVNRFSFNADDVWAASVQAYDTNQAYVKYIDDDTKHTETNRQIVDRLLSDTTQITQTSRDKAIEVRRYYQAFTFKVLKGNTLSEFDNNSMIIANREYIETNYDMAVIVSLPASYEKSIARNDANRRINWARGGYLGELGEKVATKIEVLKCVWSTNWGTFYITGITDDDKVVYFASKKEIKIGESVKIQGTVKTYRDNSTQLNRVKVII